MGQLTSATRREPRTSSLPLRCARTLPKLAKPGASSWPLGRNFGDFAFTTPPTEPGFSITGRVRLEVPHLHRLLVVGGPAVRGVVGQQLELGDVPRREVPAVRVELEDLLDEAGVGLRAPEATVDQGLLAVGSYVEQPGGDLGVGVGELEVRDDGRGAHQRVAGAARGGQAIGGGAGLVGGRGLGAGAAARDRVEGGADRRIAGGRRDRLRRGRAVADLALGDVRPVLGEVGPAGGARLRAGLGQGLDPLVGERAAAAGVVALDVVVEPLLARGPPAGRCRRPCSGRACARSPGRTARSGRRDARLLVRL